ncbi:MAG: TRZ/ATZ family hydrolase [Betaproteobacteria bacterium]|nr:MAG: TRZ/ATZ family hydrolase [Betaproteobacteria bacterium]
MQTVEGAQVQPVELLVSARWVIPVEPPETVLADHSVAVAGGRILAVLPTAEAERRYRPAERVRLDRHALIPGLVNLHTHASMTLMRGLADDLPLMTWLKDHIWPVEAKHVSPEFVYDGTLLACAEMLRGGVTCFNEMYFFPEAAARAALAAGIRAALGIIAFEFPTPYASDADDYIAKGLAARDSLKQEPLLSFCMAPHAPYTVSDRTFARVVTIAEELDLPIHVHLHETRHEIDESLAQFKARPLERLRALGLLGPRLIAVHAVHVTEQEIATLARFGASVAHCPSSNLKLASGFAPVAAMLKQRINVGLGTDGAASNNRLDVLQEMRTAALLAKAVGNDAEAMPAHQALAAATLHGARALGLDASIGSLAPGKFADLCAVAFDRPELLPCYDVASHLVYSAGREHVSHVWIGGEPRVNEGRLLRFENLDLNKRILLWHNKLAAES